MRNPSVIDNRTRRRVKVVGRLLAGRKVRSHVIKR